MQELTKRWRGLVGGVAVAALCAGPAWAAPADDPSAEDSDTLPDVLPSELGQTWVEIDGVVYGAQPDEHGPIGGGEGYKAGLTSGDYTINTQDDKNDLDELLEALAQAKSGETVFLPGDAMIDCTVRVVVEEDFVLRVPEGVTLASDRGHNGSPGAIIISDALDTDPLIEVAGPDVRISGLRIHGPDKRIRNQEHARTFREGGRKLYYKFPVSFGIRCEEIEGLEVDNCEITGWAYALRLTKSQGHHVHHNYFHHNSRRSLGYGVSVGEAEALIERNLFDYHRHAIVSSGRPGSAYEARHNVVLRHAGGGRCHSFDMHGGRVSADNKWILAHHENQPNFSGDVAGSWMNIHHNQFRMTHREAVRIRGTPLEPTKVQNNWFFHDTPGGDVIDCGGNITVSDNIYGEQPQRKPENPGYAKYPADN